MITGNPPELINRAILGIFLLHSLSCYGRDRTIISSYYSRLSVNLIVPYCTFSLIRPNHEPTTGLDKNHRFVKLQIGHWYGTDCCLGSVKTRGGSIQDSIERGLEPDGWLERISFPHPIRVTSRARVGRE